jgi:hypothetical protein
LIARSAARIFVEARRSRSGIGSRARTGDARSSPPARAHYSPLCQKCLRRVPSQGAGLAPKEGILGIRKVVRAGEAGRMTAERDEEESPT